MEAERDPTCTCLLFVLSTSCICGTPYTTKYIFLDLDLNNEFFKMTVVSCVRLRNVNEVSDFN